MLTLAVFSALTALVVSGLTFGTNVPGRKGRRAIGARAAETAIIAILAMTAGLWVEPVGPVLMGVHPLPVIYTAVIVALMRKRTPTPKSTQGRQRPQGMLSRIQNGNRHSLNSPPAASRRATSLVFALAALALFAGLLRP